MFKKGNMTEIWSYAFLLNYQLFSLILHFIRHFAFINKTKTTSYFHSVSSFHSTFWCFGLILITPWLTSLRIWLTLTKCFSKLYLFGEFFNLSKTTMSALSFLMLHLTHLFHPVYLAGWEACKQYISLTKHSGRSLAPLTEAEIRTTYAGWGPSSSLWANLYILILSPTQVPRKLGHSYTIQNMILVPHGSGLGPDHSCQKYM